MVFIMQLCLNAIVKNEMVNLPRMLGSVLGYVTVAVIYDTGSTDGTQRYIKEFFGDHNVPCLVEQGVFKDFSQARNAALILARTYKPHLWDFLLLMDADMELVVEAPLPELNVESYNLLQRQGGLDYYNTRLLRRGSNALYHGVTHEYLSTNKQEILPGDVYWFKDYATGSNRGEKYERDIRLLEGYLKDHPDDGRTLFYLAQTYRDNGDLEKAIDLYKQRVEVGGWEEEVWYSKLQIARCYKSLGEEAEFVLASLDAYNTRPIRAEPIYDLTRHFREAPDKQQTGLLFAEAGSKMSKPKDMLFIEAAAYNYGFLEELSILGAYNDKTKDIGFQAADKLSLSKNIPDHVRDNTRRNLYWYLQPLKTMAKSFTAVKIPDINLDCKFTNCNPSVAVVNDQLKAIVRTVSYRIRPDGTYDYNGNNSIRTTSFLCDFSNNLVLEKAVELLRPIDFPEPVTTEVRDIEDLRLIPYKDELYANGCVLEQNNEFWREQFLFKIDQDTGELTNWKRIDPKFIPKQHEKNWMPILGNDRLSWMYRPGVVMLSDGAFITQTENKLAVDQFSGGGQVVPFEAGWVGIIHEVRPNPINGKRWYQHRFIWFDLGFVLQKVSKPFVFFDRQIEFAAGLAFYKGSIIISFGVRDCEAWLASISQDDLRDLIWAL